MLTISQLISDYQELENFLNNKHPTIDNLNELEDFYLTINYDDNGKVKSIQNISLLLIIVTLNKSSHLNLYLPRFIEQWENAFVAKNADDMLTYSSQAKEALKCPKYATKLLKEDPKFKTQFNRCLWDENGALCINYPNELANFFANPPTLNNFARLQSYNFTLQYYSDVSSLCSFLPTNILVFAASLGKREHVKFLCRQTSLHSMSQDPKNCEWIKLYLNIQGDMPIPDLIDLESTEIPSKSETKITQSQSDNPPEPEKQSYLLLNTPDEILETIATYVEKDSLPSLGLANTAFFNASRISRLGPHLLRHVMNGNQKTVSEMLTKHFELLDYRRDFPHDGQTYININAFELALTNSSPKEMAPLIYTCIYNHKQVTKYGQSLFNKQLGKAFLEHVAKGNQEAAKEIIKKLPEFLLFEGTFIDYSGREFNCTAYEYAWWAKHTNMRRMLEIYMDNHTKTELLTRIKKIITNGLSYRQNGQEFHSPNFDFTPLISALEKYAYGFDDWYEAENMNEIKAAWMKVGLLQRDVPAHVAREYGRLDRSFVPTPSFREETLPQNSNEPYDSWFPLMDSSSELGFDFAIERGNHPECMGVSFSLWAMHDLEAIIHLNSVRTEELQDSLECLRQPINLSILEK